MSAPLPQPTGTPKTSNGMYLNCHSYYSFNYGVMSVEDLLRYGHAMGATHLALTDINNTSGCLDFLRLAPNYGIQPIIGIDFRNGNTQLYIGIAFSNLGFRHLNEYLSKYKMAKQDLPLMAPVLEGVVFIYPWVRGMKTALLEGHYIGVKPHELTHFRLYGKKHPPGKVVILNTVSFRHKTDFNTHRLLCAIGNNALLSKLEPSLHGTETDVLIPQAKLLTLYAELPQAANNTLTITETAQVYFEFGKSKNKKTYLGNEADDYALLAKLAKDGLDYRYPQQTDKVKQRLAHELETIGKLGFTPYFLINWDMVRFASSQGFFHVGRGSGANSLVAYCMGITDVDPMELDLYFERFINPSRKNPPDFDIDFSHTDRDTVRRYLFDKYPGHTALVGAYSTFEHKAAIREIGKVFGLPPHEIDQLQADRKTASPQQDQYGKLIMHYAAHIHGLPNLLTVHACGVLISEEPITCYSALELPPVGFPVTQYSMLEAEDVGLYKYDVLSQRGLGHIKDAVGFIKTNQGIDIDIHDIKAFKEDLRIKQMLKTGDTIGCFYVESPAMRQLMRKLMVDDYLGLVAASSVIRPGVSSSGMMRQYILRYRYPDKRKEAHPKLLEIMPETFGVMVYQEDVIKVAHYYAGLSLEESDVMRRGMSGKFRSRAEFQRVEDKFFENCQERGYPEEEAKEIWRQVESFAGYSFAKGHSASFAVESYQSLYLRAYYPIEFITAVVNNFGGFYSTEHYLHEARMLGATVELPCVNNSDDLCVLRGTTIYMALCLIKDLERGTVKALLSARKQDGPYVSLQDFITRVSISLEQLRILIRIKAFRFTGKSSKELLWEAHMALSKTKKTDPKPELFKAKPEPTQLPELEYGQNEDAFDEMQILGFPFASPFNLMKKQYKGLVMADELMEHLGNVVYIVGYFVTLKPVVTITNQRMFFGSFIDHQGKLFDTVHFPQSVARNSTPSKGCYLLKGTVIEDFDVPSIEVSHMERIPWAID